MGSLTALSVTFIYVAHGRYINLGRNDEVGAREARSKEAFKEQSFKVILNAPVSIGLTDCS